MKKDETEGGLRSLCHKWRNEAGHADTPPEQLSFSEFEGWVQQHYPSYLDFRTTTSVLYDAEMWFDQEFKQTWRR